MADDPPISREFRLLAGIIGPGSRGFESADLTDIDWALFLNLAARHRVTPAVAASLERHAARLPPPIAEALHAAATSAAFDELALAATLRRILAAFSSAAMPVGVLKGIPLSLDLHGRFGLRMSRDIDLVVAPETVTAALTLLASQGFAPRAAVSEKWLRRHKDLEIVNPTTRQIVELHWRLFDNPYLLPMDGSPQLVWQSFPFGLDCLVLPERLNLLYLAGHGAQHGWSRLKWLADLAALIDRIGPADRNALYAGTTLAEGRRALAQALLLCDELFGMAAPPAVIEDARRDWRLRALRRIALVSMTAGGAREMESLRFGTTRKNVSHYLLNASPAYLAEELRFDLADFSAAPAGSRWRWLGPLGRVGNWMQRHLLPR